ncbi:MAG: Gfo/Idh/MocA family oxidoreductase [Acidobacteriota bacterium]|nr:Gfo/Idh/MocA family oxidoreductase [Acidobacteriota bacterium]
MTRLGVGIVGYGAMARAHAYAYRAAPLIRPGGATFVPVVMSGRDAEALARAARECGVDETTTRWREVVERADVDVVDICTPPGTHAEIAVAAAAAGKAVLCEKPLATSYAAAREARDAVVAAGVHHAVGFNYRRLPALALLAEMVERGDLGEVRLWRGTWLSDEFVDPAIPFDWRFDAAMGGTTIADLGSHLIDLATWMLGPVADVSASSATFVTQRAAPGGARRVEVDDASSALIRFASGARGTMEVARCAPRRPCDFVVEVNGSLGTAMFSYARLNELWFASTAEDERHYGLRRIRAEHPRHPQTRGWWPIGQGVGYDASFINQVGDLAAAWPDRPWDPGFDQGAEVAAVCEAMERSAASGSWTSVADVTGAA